jgi:hypothetical protein
MPNFLNYKLKVINNKIDYLFKKSFFDRAYLQTYIGGEE